jgi:hypothetical protein
MAVGQIHVAGGMMDCVVRDISCDGASILIAKPSSVPQRFALEQARHGKRDCRVVWRSSFALGVRFLSDEE